MKSLFQKIISLLRILILLESPKRKKSKIIQQFYSLKIKVKVHHSDKRNPMNLIKIVMIMIKTSVLTTETLEEAEVKKRNKLKKLPDII